MKKKLLILFFTLSSIVAYSIIDSNLSVQSTTGPDLPATPYNYANIPLPSDVINNLSGMDNTPTSNPITDDGATLGRVLFYDVELSQNRTVSCASCHIQKFSFTDTARFSRGFNGALTSRNSMGLIHARFQRDSAFFWDNRAPSLEAQVLMPIVSTVEMGLTLDTLVARVSAKPYYAQLFQNAFGTTAVTTDRISKALAQFVRSMNTFGSKFRQGVEITNGNPETTPFSNFTAQENLGKSLFMDITRGNCQACHTRNVMVQQGAQNIGLDLVYADNGVGAASGRHAQDGKFSVPSLINVALTPPYMHDGRFKTLEEVIDFYSDSIKAHVNLSGFLREIIPGTVNPNNNTCDTCAPRRPHYTATEKAALVAFLKTLTDTVITTDVRWSNPFTCGTHNVVNQTLCGGSFTWNGTTYTSSGVYVYNYVNTTGCPSADTLRLTINHGTFQSSQINACDSFVWNGNVYRTSGTYVRNYINATGCSSSDTLRLTINNATHSSYTANACDSFVWNGNVYRASGNYIRNYVNGSGCNSADTLHLTINNSTHQTTVVSSCNSYSWNGVNYTTSGTYTYAYTNTSGCNAVDTLRLTINSPSTSTTNLTICNTSLPYSWNGISCATAGTYTKTITNVSGCDSVMTLNLLVNTGAPTLAPTITQSLVSNVCGAKVYRYTSSIVTNAAGYQWMLPASVGGVSGVYVDSGDINTSRIIKVRYASNLAAVNGDSVRVRAFSACGSTLYRSAKLVNTLLTAPASPSSITITAVSINTCGQKIYRYTAPTLPVATTTAMAATGYVWTMPFGPTGSTGVLDSGTLASRIIRIKYSSNAAAVTGDSIKVQFTSACGNSLPKAAKLTNTLLGPPSAPASITASLVSDVCGARIYRYTAPLLASASTITMAATGYVWTMPFGPTGSTGVLDSGTLSSRIIRVKYSSNAAAATGDSIKVQFSSGCGNSLPKAIKLTNLVKSCLTARNTGSSNADVNESSMYAFDYNIYPNPASDHFIINLKNRLYDYKTRTIQATLKVYDEAGRIMWSKTIDSEDALSFGSEWKQGVYIVEITYNGKPYRKKIIKL